MSAQFGTWNFDGRIFDRTLAERMASVLAPHGPDGLNSSSSAGFGVVHASFCTTKEALRETQPSVSPSGLTVTWDGRLDNRPELVAQLADAVCSEAADALLVAAAYDRWGTQCFAKLLGDWAVSIWCPQKRSLTLAKDFVGTRPLYYHADSNGIVWSTVLDALVLELWHGLTLDQEFLAGWLTTGPSLELSPYREIRSVPASCYVRFEEGKSTVQRYWNFNPTRVIRYRADSEYEEHFRLLFAKSVGRRLRSDFPVLAELSGGMDSSAIVCVGDTLLARGLAKCPRLDTLSFFDESEPNWNERPYFTKIEENRGRVGFHIDVGLQNRRWGAPFEGLASTPNSAIDQSEPARQLRLCFENQGNRVLLSGYGGDEVTGGVPTPLPELSDLVATGQFRTLWRQMLAWARAQRKPILNLAAAVVQGFLPRFLRTENAQQCVPWLEPDFVRGRRSAPGAGQARLRLFRSLPSFQDNLDTLDALRRQLACSPLPNSPVYEKRFPFLDRELLEFLYAIPREQLVRPCQRRSLLRRALAGTVPNEILYRKRKAFVARAPLAFVSANWPCFELAVRDMLSASLGIVNAEAFLSTLTHARNGLPVPTVQMMRTLEVEAWLNHLAELGLCGIVPHSKRLARASSHPRPIEVH